MTIPSTLIRFVGKKSLKSIYIKAVRFADGPGMTVKSMSLTLDKEQAAGFSTAQAFEIALQFFKYPATLELRSAGVLENDTKKLQAEQVQKFEAYCEVRRQARLDMREVNDFFDEAVRAIGVKL